MLNNYITINGKGEGEVIEKKSRFIAIAMPVSTEDEVIKHIEETKKQYYDARHNCYAYQIGKNSLIQRYSDDGEPKGTAGIPMLDILKGNNITNALVIVTRYFGGTLLGTGGLVRAYSSAAKLAITNAGIIQKVLHSIIHINVDYTLAGKIQYEILNSGNILKDILYTDRVEFIVLVDTNDTNSFLESIINITNNTAKIIDNGTTYVDKDI